MNQKSSQAMSCWAGRIVAALVVFALFADAASILMFPSSMQAKFAATGFPDNIAPVLGGILVVCTVLYAIPRTAVLGAIVLTGFLGGAVCAHFRLGEIGSAPQVISVVLGVLLWGALYLRNARVRSLLPLTA